MRRFLYVLILIVGISSASSIVHAADFSSASFTTKNPLLDALGGFGTSTSFSSIWSGGQTATGESTSTNFTLATGFLYFDSFTPQSQSWRWYDDESDETPTVPLAGEGAAPTGIGNGDIVKLRMTIGETADIGAAGEKFALQYSTSSDFSSGHDVVVEQGSCTSGSVWCYADGAGVDDAVVSSSVISDADTCVLGFGNGCGTHNESGTSASTFTHTKSAVAEYEFTLQQSGASPNTVYFFRAYDMTASSTVPHASLASYPSLVTGGTTLSVVIGGIASSTAVEGITTDVDTTPTGIAFGHVPLGTPVNGAQRFTVTTNAGSGYRIFAYEQQALLSGSGDEIAPVSGTNASPAGWSTGCTATTGCYGYHAGDDVLQGGSTRFAPDDTYARFSSSPSEVAYSAGPAANRVTDMVYRVEARGLQEAGSYDSSLIYIIVPVF